MKGLTWLIVAAAVLSGIGLFTAVDAGAQNAVARTPAAEATPAAAAPSGAAAPGAVASDYVIGPEDILQVSVWKNDSLSRIVPVRPDGKISLPLLHDIQASGLTTMQLRDKLAVALAEFMPNPEVSVIVNEVRSYRVSVLGEVQKPGVLQLRSSTTILEAIAMAGGFRDFASPSKIVIFRKDDTGQTKKIRFNYNRAVGSSALSLNSLSLGGDKSASDDQNLTLKSGDVIVVP
jgi:polysaccharide biosynthesis/export protein